MNGRGPRMCSQISLPTKITAMLTVNGSRRTLSQAARPAVMSPCSTPDRPTYQAIWGSNARNPRSMAAVEASITTLHSPGEYSRGE